MTSKKQSWFSFLKWLDPFTYVDIILEKTIGKQEGFWKTIVYWGIYILTAFVCAVVLYKFIGLLLGVSEPMAIVVTSSMVPTLHVGDIVIFTRATNLNVPEVELNKSIGYKDLTEFADVNYYVNEYGLTEAESITVNGKTFFLEDAIKNMNSIVVYKSNIEGKDIIHRAVLKINAKDGNFLLTKGDNHKTNLYIDQDCNIYRDDSGKIIPQKPCLNIYPLKQESVNRKKIGKIPYIGYIKLVLFQ